MNHGVFKESPQYYLARQKSKKQLQTVAKKEAKKLYSDVRKEVLEEVTSKYHLVWLLALRDVYGFGHVRMQRLFEKVLAISEGIGEGLLDFDDIAQTLIDEGILTDADTLKGGV